MAAKDIKAGIKITGQDTSASAFASFSRSIHSADSSVGKFSVSLGQIGRGVGVAGGLVVGAAAAIGGAAVAIGAGVLKLADSAFQYVDNLSDIAAVTGLTASAVEKMNYVFELSGVDSEKATVAYRKFAKSLLEIDRPGDKVYKSLRKISPEFARMVKDADNNSDAMQKAMSALAGMENGTKKNALAQALFGKSSLDVLAVLNKGKEAYDALAAAAEKNGVVTDDMTAKADAYEVAFKNMSMATNGLKVALGVELMPMLTDAATEMAKFITDMRPDLIKASSGLIKSMGEMLKSAIDYLVANPDALKDFFSGAVDSMKGVVDEFKNIKELIDDTRTFWGDVKDMFGGGLDRRDKALSRSGSGIIYGTENAGQRVDAGVQQMRAFEASTAGSGPLGLLNPNVWIKGISDAVAAGAAAQKNNLDITLRYVGGKEAFRAQISSQGGGVNVSESKNYFDPGAFE